MTTVIFSLGQLISSNLQTLKDSFQSALADEGKNITGEVVWKWMAGYLPRLRLNKLTLDELCCDFNAHFSTSMTLSNFTTCFNSMCHVDEQSLNRVAQLNDFLNENTGIHVVVVSHTNFSQLNHIMEQLEHVMPNCRAGIVCDATTGEQEAKMLFATSMYSQCEQHTETLQWAIKKLEINLDEPIISFLNTIDTIEKIEYATDFTYEKADSILDVDKVIEILHASHRSIAQCGI